MILWSVCKKLCKWGLLALFLLLVALTLLPEGLFANAATETEGDAPTPVETMVAFINSAREKEGLLPLSPLDSLHHAADVRAAELSVSFSHTRPDGTPGFSVLSAQNIPYGTAAENLAVGYTTADAAATAFMASKGHRANILGDYRHIGVGFRSEDNSWVLLFIGGCEAHTLSVSGNLRLESGAALADANGTLALTCAPHGQTAIPLPAYLCTGYQPNETGTQSITLTYGSATCDFAVHIGAGSAAPTPVFSDVPTGAWYAQSVYTLVERGVLSGTGETTFSPGATLTRGMLVTMLGRMANVDESAYARSVFSDVKVGDWYAPYVQWAYEKGIATGYGNGVFAPNTPITREQLCVFLVRYAGATGTALPTAGGDGFTDAARISDWAKDAVSLAAKANLIGGYTDGTFRPQASATRAETASVLAKFLDL